MAADILLGTGAEERSEMWKERAGHMEWSLDDNAINFCCKTQIFSKNNLIEL